MTRIQKNIRIGLLWLGLFVTFSLSMAGLGEAVDEIRQLSGFWETFWKTMLTLLFMASVFGHIIGGLLMSIAIDEIKS